MEINVLGYIGINCARLDAVANVTDMELKSEASESVFPSIESNSLLNAGRPCDGGGS